jgi:hypothetical protein
MEQYGCAAISVLTVHFVRFHFFLVCCQGSVQKMVKPKRRSEDLPFSSDDEIDSDDFDSDSDSGHEWREQESAPVIKSRNKYVTGLYSALGITEDEVQILKAEKDNADVCSGSQSATASVRSSSGRPPPEIIVFDDPAKRHKVSFVLLIFFLQHRLKIVCITFML